MGYTALKTSTFFASSSAEAAFWPEGIMMLTGSPLLKRKLVRVLPHIIDTALLASAVAMVVMLGASALAVPWLIAKIVGLLVHIGLGTVALKRGRSKGVRNAFVLALLTFAYIVSVALSKDPPASSRHSAPEPSHALAHCSNPPPASTEPLELLAACHERIHDRLSLPGAPATPPRGTWLRPRRPHRRSQHPALLQHRRGPPPRRRRARPLPALLAAVPNEQRADLETAIARLLDEHRRMFAAWATLRSKLEPIEAGTATDLPAETVAAFCKLYREHIRFEEANAFGPAKTLLSEATRSRLGKAMALRRGVKH